MGRPKKDPQESTPASVPATTIQDKLIQAMQAEVSKLIDRNDDVILNAYRDAVELHNEADSDKKFVFKVPVSISITGIDPNTYEVTAKMACAVKYTDSVTAQVRDGADLVDMMEAE